MILPYSTPGHQPLVAMLPEWLTDGRAAFVLVFILLLLGLIMLPRWMRDWSEPARFWRRPRFWAILIVFIQILVYLRWG